MIAATYNNYGKPSRIQVKEIEKPSFGDDDVLVNVRASTVSRTDCSVLSGSPYIFRLFLGGLLKPKRKVLGTDFAGSVVAVGKNISKYKPGDRVFGFQDEGLSTQAQYAVINKDAAMLKIPDGYSYEDAAASCEGPHYAVNFMNKVTIDKGANVLINGATGGIGTSILQLLKTKDVKITAVCDTKNISLIESMGPDKVVDYLTEDFTDTDEKFDFVFDTVGKSSFPKCKKILKTNGIYISSELGRRGANILYAMTTPIFSKKKVIFPLPTNILRSISIIQDLVEKGKFKPVIDRVYDLEEIDQAYTYVAKGFKTGNVVIKIPPLEV